MNYIILDRDGVINYDSEEYIKSPDEWHPIPGSLAAIARLNRAGYEILIATNQSGVARGLYDETTLHQIHAKLHNAVAEFGGKITEIFYCPHHPDEKCLCRKPQPGLLQQIAAKYSLDLQKTYFIGDSIVDVRAALQAGCEPIIVLTGNGKSTVEKFPEVLPFRQYEDLAHAAESICR